MVWHIFKKDVRLLWPLALSVVILQALCAALTSLMGYFNEPAQLAGVARHLPVLVYLGVFLLGVAVVHQEPLETVRADWLVRPISRKDVLLSKVLFMVLMVNLPIMLVDVAQQLALHFPLSSSIGVAACRSLGLMLFVSLPALVLGAVTRSMTHAFAFGIVFAVVFCCLLALVLAFLSPGLAVSLGGQTWIVAACAGVVMTLGGAATLAFQYSTRRTFRARCIGMAAMLAVMFTFIGLPNDSATAIQEWLWGRSNGSEITLRFDPDAKNGGNELDRLSMTAGGNAVPPRAREQIVQVHLPLRISGMHPGDVLFADRPAVRITAMSGSMLYQGSGVCVRESVNLAGIACLHNTLEILATPQVSSDTQSEQRLYLPMTVYERIKDQSVRVDITYHLTRFARQTRQAIAATGGVRPIAEMGSCGTRIDNGGDEVEVGCLTNVGIPACIAVVLEDPRTNTRNPELHECNPNYAPFRRAGPFDDAVSRLSYRIPFLDPSGLAHYPVGSAAIQRARVVLITYDPVEHFHRTLVVSSIQLAQWAVPYGTDGGNALVGHMLGF